MTSQPDARAALEIVAKHRRHIELSPGVGVERQRYALAVLDDVEYDLAALADAPVPPATLTCHHCNHEQKHHVHGEGTCIVYGCPCFRFYVLPEPVVPPATEEETAGPGGAVTNEVTTWKDRRNLQALAAPVPALTEQALNLKAGHYAADNFLPEDDEQAVGYLVAFVQSLTHEETR